MDYRVILLGASLVFALMPLTEAAGAPDYIRNYVAESVGPMLGTTTILVGGVPTASIPSSVTWQLESTETWYCDGTYTLVQSIKVQGQPSGAGGEGGGAWSFLGLAYLGPYNPDIPFILTGTTTGDGAIRISGDDVAGTTSIEFYGEGLVQVTAQTLLPNCGVDVPLPDDPTEILVECINGGGTGVVGSTCNTVTDQDALGTIQACIAGGGPGIPGTVCRIVGDTNPYEYVAILLQCLDGGGTGVVGTVCSTIYQQDPIGTITECIDGGGAGIVGQVCRLSKDQEPTEYVAILVNCLAGDGEGSLRVVCSLLEVDPSGYVGILVDCTNGQGDGLVGAVCASVGDGGTEPVMELVDKVRKRLQP